MNDDSRKKELLEQAIELVCEIDSINTQQGTHDCRAGIMYDWLTTMQKECG